MEYQEGQYKEVATTINCVLPLLRISIRSLSKKRAVVVEKMTRNRRKMIAKTADS